MFTPELKDELLQAITEPKLSFLDFNPSELASSISMPLEQLEALLEYFERKGFISNLTFMLGGLECQMTVNVEAFDFYRAGGFKALEQTFELELQKLQKEVEALQKTYPDRAGRMLSALSNLASVISFFKP